MRHSPPGRDATEMRCAYLEALIEAALGLPLAPAAELVTPARSRGRFGNALQWHLGLEPHDGAATLDWEDRIEIKMVSVWRRRGGALGCDKLKVCDISIDPWRKLGNVLWVFVDRLTRVVVGHRFFRLAGALRAQLEADYALDPHFDHPNLFVETREQDTRQAPAYYLAARWLRDAAILPSSALGVFPFDARWWSEARRAHGRDEPPKIALWEPGDGAMTRCPRCDGALRVDAARVDREGWSPAIHAMPLGERCALHAHLVVDARALPLPKGAPGRAELEAGITGQVTLEKVWRLADRIPEPDDHLHA